MSNFVRKHLVVIQHGMWGTKADTSILAEQIINQIPHSVVLNSTANQFLNTYHGIDVCGQRLVEEVKSFLAGCEPNSISKISFIGYSAGGLFCRYAIALLDSQKIFDTIQPDHFITVATPHLGIRHSSNDPVGRVWNKTTNVSHFYGGRSAYQMALLDYSDGENFRFPLLVDLSLPQSAYVIALKKFRRILFYANAKNDRSVNYCSASISPFNPYKDSSPPPALNENYPSIIAETRIDLENSNSSNDQQLTPRTIRRSSTLSAATTVAGAVALSPILVAHAAIVFGPMKLISWMSDPGEVPQTGRPQSSRDLSSTEEQLNDSGEFQLDRFPALIRDSLVQLPITRVVCYFTELNTHGVIISRRFWNKNGKQVVSHICSNLAGDEQQQ